MQSLLASKPDSPEAVAKAREAIKADIFVGFKAVKLIRENLKDLLTGTINPLSLFSSNDILGRLYSKECN